MPEQRRKKDHFQFNKGINTESNEVSFPDGFSTDERNYELLIDGSRKRRKGLAQETGGSSKATGQTIGAGHAYTTYNWRGVGGDPDRNYVVHQIGELLFFTNDAETISTTYHSDAIELTNFIADTGTHAVGDVEDEVCQFSQGRGVLLVTHKHLEPFYIEYNTATDNFTSAQIRLLVRDFDGIDDGVSSQLSPTSLSAEHKYNLRNRGWSTADITEYQANSVGSVYPNKAQVWFKAYRRITDVGFSDLDGIQDFSTAKMQAEAFGQSSAPQGGLLIDPMDTRFSAATGNDGAQVSFTNIEQRGTNTFIQGATLRFTSGSAVHGRTTGDMVTMSGVLLKVARSVYEGDTSLSLDGFYQVTVIDVNNFDITLPPILTGDMTYVITYGQISGATSLARTDGSELAFGPAANAYHAGRAWFAGIQDAQWADTVFFSKIAQKASGFGTCHQATDPTNPEFNQLASDDGGTIVIPNLGQVKRMLPMRDSLLIFSDRGVWEVGGSKRGVFTALEYSVRKITEAECSSDRSPVVIGNRAVYTGPRGIHLIAPNEFTSVLEETNVSEQLIQTLWNAIPSARQAVVQTAYDSALKRIYFLYDNGEATQADESSYTSNTNQFNNALILDLRTGAYYRFQFNTSSTAGLIGLFSITESDESDSNKKIKWTTQSMDSLVTCDLSQTDFLDFNGSESPLPYAITGWDHIGDFQRRRRAPVITVYAKRTETAYTATGDGYDPVNESSNLLTAYWDWTDDSISGKIGSQNETYRHVRGFVPSGTGDVDGYPVVTTRNKLRGRGRVLQLRFDGAATKDSHILGFTVNYKVARGI